MSGMDYSTLRDQFPYYLTEEKQLGLDIELQKIFDPNKIGSFNYYSLDASSYANLPDMMQGDVWLNVNLKSLNVGNHPDKSVSYIVLSNTCDISAGNSRKGIPKNVVLAPLISVEKFRLMLDDCGLESSVIEAKIFEIKKQTVTDMFYLPRSSNLEESIALLDQIVTLPLSKMQDFISFHERVSLALSGFYLFLLKLSLHFCRLHENVAR